MKRLCTASTTNDDPQHQILNSAAESGHEILKQLEQWKFQLNQCKNITQMSQDGNKIKQDFDIIDSLMSSIYNVCFNLENFEIVPETPYDADQININNGNAYDAFNLAEEVPLEEEENIQNVEIPENEDEESEATAEGDTDNTDKGDFDFNF